MDSGGLSLFNTYSPPKAGSPAAVARALQQSDETAQNFEGMFMSQMMQFMWTDVKSDEIFGGGHAEEVWRGMMVDEMGGIASKTGGLGIADQVKAELLKVQEAQGLIPASAVAEHEQSMKRIR